MAKNNQFIKFRLTALYHNCHSAACFKRADAEIEEDEKEARTMRLEAQAYEACAGWIDAAIKSGGC